MADRSQNININYKFNTAEIDKANAALAKANQASNKLQQDAGKGFGAADKSVNNYGSSIAGLSNQLKVLENRVKLAANPKDLQKWSGEWAKVKTQLDAATKSAFGFEKATTGMNQGMNQLVLGFRQFSRIAGVGLIAGITKEIVDVTLSLSTLQGQVEGVERGFNRAFVNPTETLNQVREATQGTITDFDLMKRTLQATNLGVSVERLGTLFEFAAARAQQTGESVDYLVDSIVRGIGRKSPLVLDNLGISVTALKEKFDGASIASKTVAEATEGVAEIAEEQLKKMGGFVRTSETEVKDLGVAWENVRIAFAKKIEASGLINFFTEAAKGLENLIKGGEVLRNEEAKNQAASRLTSILNDDIFKDRKKNQLAQLDLLMQELISTKELIRVKGVEIEQFEKAKTEAEKRVTVDEFGNIVAKETITFREQAIEGLKKQMAAYEALVPQIANALRVMQAEMDLENTHIETLDEMRERLEGLKKKYGETGNSGIEAFESQVPAIKELEAEIKKIEDLLKDPKTLKIKVVEFEDDLKKLAQKFFDEGGGLKDVELNPSTGEVFDRKAFEANEVIDVEKMEDGAGEAAEKVADSFWTRFRLAFKRKATDSDSDIQDALKDAEMIGIDILSNQLMSLADVESNTFDARIRKARNFYEEQSILAGNNEKAKDHFRILEDKKLTELRRKQFVADQKAAKQKALINGAAAIVKTFAEYGFTPAAIIANVALAAATASQIAIIERNQPRFKDGVLDLKGPGTSTSDSISARLSKHETVMPAWATNSSRGIFKEIFARRLDDKVLKGLREGRSPVVAGMSDQGIIKAIKDNRAPDVIEQSGIVYKATKKSDDYIKKQRAKSVRI